MGDNVKILNVKSRTANKFRRALEESVHIIVDIRKNGTDGYRTLDDLLNETENDEK